MPVTILPNRNDPVKDNRASSRGTAPEARRELVTVGAGELEKS